MKIATQQIKSFLIGYFAISLFLSVTIVLRLLVTSFTNEELSAYKIVGGLNVLSFYLHYYVMPAIASSITIFNFIHWKKPDSGIEDEKNLLSLFFLLFILFWFIDSTINHPFSYILFPLISLVILSYIYRKQFFPAAKLQKIGMCLCLAGILFLPYIVTYFGYNHQLSIISNQENTRNKIEVISNFAVNSHTPFWGDFGKIFYYPLRANDDFLKFLMLGVGSCGEMAFSTTKYLDYLGLDSRIVRFPGEDHVIVEVYYENEWLVIDPGYFYTLISQQERGLVRVNEMGGLSYVVTDYNDTRIDLTEKYVSTDEITIKVTKGNLPVPNASVILKHKFLGSNRSLPQFTTDNNGTFTINLGPMNYTDANSKSFYWIIVDGIETKQKVTSSASGNSKTIEVDITVYN